MFQETTIFLQIISQEKQSILTMTTLDKIKELDDSIIEFNEYLETVSTGLEHLDTGVKAIVENIRVEVEELSKETEKIISNVKHDLEQGRIVVAEMLKTLSTTKSSLSTMPTTSMTKLQLRKLQSLVQAFHFLKKRRKC